MSLLDGLTLLFLGLKLTDNIQWPWFWVLTPVWLPILAAVVFVVWSAVVKK